MARPRQISDEAILLATLKCVEQFGHNFSTSAVAERVQISPQAVLKRMGNKQELLIRTFVFFVNKELCEPFFTPYDDRLFRTQLLAHARRLTEHCRWLNRFQRLFISNGVCPSDAVARFKTAPHIEIQRQFQLFLSQAQAKGEPIGQTGPISTAFIGAIGYQCQLNAMFSDQANLDSYEAFLESVCDFITELVTSSDESSIDDAASEHPVEIERKYLLHSMPTVPLSQIVSIRTLEQGYIPGTQITERVRRITEGEVCCFRRTVKLGSGIQRLEFEEEIDASLFEHLWAATEKARIRKERTVVRDGALLWEIDRFLDLPLYFAEVELPSVDTRVDMPSWLAPVCIREVTNEKNFTNWALATQSGHVNFENGEK